MELIHVTEILSPFFDKNWVTDEGRDRGSSIHRANANYARGVWMPRLADDYQGYFESFQRWFDKYVKKVHLVETILEDPDYGFCGTLDIIVTMIDGIMTIVDYKTSQAKGKTWPLQISAYCHLAEKAGFKIERVGSLQLKKDGNIAIFNPSLYRLSDFNVFLSALNAWRFIYGE